MDLSSLEALQLTLKNNRFDSDFSDKVKIGRGGFASVYKARNNLDDRFYAIKKVKLAIKGIQKTFNLELQRLLAEAKVLASVDHPNILRYYNSWLEATYKPHKPTTHHSLSSKTHKNLEFSEDSPFILKGLDESDHENSPVQFHCSSKQPVSSSHQELFNKATEFFKNDHFEENNFIEFTENKDSESPVLRLKDHPPKSTFSKGNEVLDSVTLYLQTELCSETLEDYINNRNAKLLKLKRQNPEAYLAEKRIFIKEAIFYAKQIISAVSHIHSKQIVHRDIKPGNIFLLGRTIKIGDFGLVKRLNAFKPLEASPIFEQLSDDGNLSDSFRLDSGPKKDYIPSLEEIPFVSYQKTVSDPVYQDKTDIGVEYEGSMTRSVGTKTFASPEQLNADKEKFDHRADIFSLGLVMLLLFHPMGTSMEQHKTIKDCKNRILPSELQKELPEIGNLIVKMLAENPNDRPSLETISRQLSYPLITCSDLSGSLSIQRENSLTWAKKHFKLIDKSLYIFDKEQDKKAEQVYDLLQWRVVMKELNMDHNIEKENVSPVISLEDPMQLGCAFRTESYLKTQELFEKFRRIRESF